MKVKIICLFIIAALAISIQDSFSNPIDSLLIKLVIKNNNVSKYEDMVLDLKIKSKYMRSIFVPHFISWGFLNNNTGTGYVSLQVQIKEGNAYKDVQLSGNIDNVPSDDLDTLAFNKVRNDGFTLAGLFKPDKGEYRVRVLCFASSYNHDVKDVYSDWVYFRCLKDVRRYNSKK